MVAVRWTVPLNPFVPLMVMVNVVEDPAGTDCDDGVTVMVKSGGGGGAVTVTRMVTVWDIEPLVPVTVEV